ncbi:IclR family transcriptional regulator [Agromyces aerolatus]|uniref:IclR family transcriptional regulator n=1 Tax=Agromyces sp. LY-1074 TaxID=3074080 RepID=UPI0028672149|nr:MULTISPECIES: IclR family transcriptional regulator [unclassified Agromyces]MDR5698640.1 IclR family transcriptional regulator [Agromyces sp. LY-1074]MDR5704934.1 IclR family transcriptional regulator [Agromyces sp. LY-1358]
MASQRSKVPAADQTLQILAHLAGQRGPVPAATIASALGLPRSTVYHLLAVLQERGFVVHLPEERRYGLGVAAFELSSGFSRQQPLTRLGRPLVAALVDRVGESGHLAVLHGRDVLYLVEERAPRRPSLVTDVGVRLPAHLTATGRAMLAALPPAQLRALYPDASAFPARRGEDDAGEPWSYGRLRRLLQGVRADGYASEHGEVTAGLASIGVAVLDHLGWPAAAIAVTFPEGTAPDTVGAIADAVGAAAATLSRRIGAQT